MEQVLCSESLMQSVLLFTFYYNAQRPSYLIHVCDLDVCYASSIGVGIPYVKIPESSNAPGERVVAGSDHGGIVGVAMKERGNL